VQIAAEPAALIITGLDDSGTGGRQLLACVDIGEGGGEELREVG
jgi:hypothetical protein